MIKRQKDTTKLSRPRLIKGVTDEDWNSFRSIVAEHNKTFPDRPVSMKSFFKLMNTYSPLIESMMQLDPNDSPVQRLGVNTSLVHAKMWMQNIGNNITRIKKEDDIRSLYQKFTDKSAIIIGAGESLYDNASGTNHLELIKKYSDKFDGIILVTGHMLEECLKLGIGDYFTVVDGSSIIYDKYFNNKTVKDLMDDWFVTDSRFMSPNIHSNSRRIAGIMATCTHPKVVNAWKGDIYFFVASIPQEILPNATSLMCDLTDSTDINAGGNCGMLGWNLAMWMGCKEVALVGMDYSYKIDTPYENNSNWEQFLTQAGGDVNKAREAYYEGYNPFFKTPYRTDQVYGAFKDVAHIWFDAYTKRGYITYNCTEGGALHGKGIEQMYLEDFLRSHCKKE
jgi:hypothetical protein